MNFDDLRAYGSGLGTAGVIVVNKNNNITEVIERFAHFYKHESCGQCTPCREGTTWLWEMMEKMANGQARVDEIDTLLNLTKRIEGHCICALGDAAAWPVQGLIRHFRDYMEDRLNETKKDIAAGL
jgi:NADH-quinone oxidoreductase subunit F